jgi:hypothetical protein
MFDHAYFFFFYFIHSVSYMFLFLLSFNKQVQWTQTNKCYILYAFNKRKKILYKITEILSKNKYFLFI